MNESLFEDPAPPPPALPARGSLPTATGGSRGNPGPSGYGAVIEDAKGQVVAELSEYLGIQTNNYAEYSGLLGVLKWVRRTQREAPARGLRLRVDGQQMQGKYKVASPSCALFLKKRGSSLGTLPVSRSATPCAAATSKPTSWRTMQWTRAWAGAGLSKRKAGGPFLNQPQKRVPHPCAFF